MINPMIKLIAMIKNRFLDLVMVVPVRSPIGVIESSTPTLKNNIPTMRRAAPIRNVIKILGGIGAMVKHKKRTIKSIGKTALRVSFSFSLNLDFILNVFNNTMRLSFKYII